MGAMTALIAALGMVPMAKAVGGFLIAPIVSGLLGILVWREPPTATRLAGSAVSFVGAAILLRPEAGLEPGSVFALIGGALLGTYLAATRGAKSQTDALSTLAVQSLLGAGLLAPFALAGGLPALTPALLAGALALGAISAVCHFLTVAAYQRAEATVLAPFLYFNLLDRDGGGLCLVRRDAGLDQRGRAAGDRRRRAADAAGSRAAGAAAARRAAPALRVTARQSMVYSADDDTDQEATHEHEFPPE